MSSDVKSIKAKRAASIARTVELSATILAELDEAGFTFSTLDELRRSGVNYKVAIPILLRWLLRVDDSGMKESLVRCLTVPWAKGIATKAVLSEFHKAANDADSLRWAIGNAMDVIADPSVGNEILSIVAAQSNGSARQMFVLAVGKLKPENASEVLIPLLEQDEVAGHAAEALGKLGAVEAKDGLERLVKSGRPWVKKAAETALGRIARLTK